MASSSTMLTELPSGSRASCGHDDGHRHWHRLRHWKALPAAAVVAVACASLVLSNAVVIPRFARIEEEAARQNLGLIVQSMFSEFASLERCAAEWSEREEVLGFLRGSASPKEAVPISSAALRDSRVTIAILLRASGHVRYSRTRGPDGVTTQILTALAPVRTPAGSWSRFRRRSGIVATAGALHLVTARQVRVCGTGGPLLGTVVLGRQTDAMQLLSLPQSLSGSIALFRVDDPNLSPECQDALAELRRQGRLLVRWLDSDTVAGYTALRDLVGRPAVLVRVRRTAVALKQGRTTMRHYLALLALLAAVCIHLSGRLTAARAKQREMEGRYRAVVEQTGDGILLVDGKTRRILEANRALLAMLGCAAGEIHDLQLRDILKGGVLDGSLADPHHTPDECRCRRKDGTEFAAEVSITRVAHGDGYVFSIVVRDITLRKAREQARALGQAEEHRRRLMARFQKSGIGGLTDQEVVELLLGIVDPRAEVIDRARDLIVHCGNLWGILDRPPVCSDAGDAPGDGLLPVFPTVRELAIAGLSARFSDNLAEALASAVVPHADSAALAAALLSRFREVRGILHASLEELAQVEGLDVQSATIIRVLWAAAGIAMRQRLESDVGSTNLDDLGRLWRARLGGLQNEVFEVAYLDAIGHLMPGGIETLEEGTTDWAAVYPRKVAEGSIRRGAVALVFAHNHPCADLEPSIQDKAITRTLVLAASSVGIRVLDHLIVSRDAVFSFQQADLL
ncbi:MAG: PAS domain S-box protein [Armatimonadetes bacterium]|nr:PAS domain S-box protein [Armatimonadota bacterium]